MVNTSLNWVSIVGIVLMIGGALLFSLRTYKPALSRDTDVFFAAVGLLCGGILFFQGWRLDPILQFSQFLLATTTIFFVYESVRLRGVTAEQARRSEFMDDPEGTEPRSRIAPIGSGLDEWDALERRTPMRRPALEAADWDQQPPARRPIRRAPKRSRRGETHRPCPRDRVGTATSRNHHVQAENGPPAAVVTPWLPSACAPGDQNALQVLNSRPAPGLSPLGRGSPLVRTAAS